MKKKFAREAAKTTCNDIIECFIDDTFSRSKHLRVLTMQIVEAQRELRAAVDDQAWAAYLKVEAAVNARASKELRVLFRRLLLLYAARLTGQ